MIDFIVFGNSLLFNVEFDYRYEAIQQQHKKEKIALQVAETPLKVLLRGYLC
eukprot:COSAG06_NODE_22570_length_719_cov_1.075806_1_plen_52_part_00